jgi:hypothetical protein
MGFQMTKMHSILGILLLVVTSPAQTGTSSVDRNRALDQLVDSLKSHQIEQIEILHVSDNLETPIRITPETVHRLARYKVVIEKPWELSSFQGLLVALQEVGRASTREAGEVRWAMVFLDGAGKERSTVYFSRDGKIGVFEGTPLSLSGTLLSWSRGLIRSAFLESGK